MKLSKWIFLSAGLFGLSLFIPLVYSALVMGTSFLPENSAGMVFFSALFQFLCWQVLFIFISSDPIRFRKMMIPAFLGLLSTSTFPIWLYIYGVKYWQYITGANLAFAILFVFAYWLTGKKGFHVSA